MQIADQLRWFETEVQMEDFQADMNQTVQRFVAQITELARRAALDTLEAAFQGEARPGARASTPPAVASGSGRPRGARGAKRTQEDIDELATKAEAFIRANPGMRIEQINKELGTTTKELALPLRKLIGERQIATKGQKRATTYFPGKKAK